MRSSNRNWRFHKLAEQSGHSTDIFWMLRRLMSSWRDDPERLAVAVTLYRELGYTMDAFEVCEGEGVDGKFVERIAEDDAFELIREALSHRPRRVLRSRAYGLLLALVDLAPLAEAWIKHEAGVGFGRIDCRERTLEEMVQHWHERDAVKESA
jgi:hypothetical protein